MPTTMLANIRCEIDFATLSPISSISCTVTFRRVSVSPLIITSLRLNISPYDSRK